MTVIKPIYIVYQIKNQIKMGFPYVRFVVERLRRWRVSWSLAPATIPQVGDEQGIMRAVQNGANYWSGNQSERRKFIMAEIKMFWGEKWKYVVI